MNDVKQQDTSAGEDGAHLTRRPGLVARMRNYFLAGVVVTAPLGLTAYLTLLFINFVDDQVLPLIPSAYNPENWLPAEYLPYGIPGLGLVIAFVFLVLVGMLTTNFLGRFFVRWGEMLLERMPVIRSIYGMFKQIFQTVLSKSSSSFREVVLIEYPRKGLWTLAFLTNTTTGEIPEQTGAKMISVFVPTTPNPTSGFLLFVPESEAHRMQMSIDEAVKLIISGGVITPETISEPEDDRPNLENMKRLFRRNGTRNESKMQEEQPNDQG